jgi:hypothetical protein
VQLGDEQNMKKMPHCGHDPFSKTCSVKMSELHETFMMPVGQRINCRVSSQNK